MVEFVEMAFVRTIDLPFSSISPAKRWPWECITGVLEKAGRKGDIDNQITIDLINHCIFESAPRGMATEEPRQVRNGMEKIYPKKTRFSIEVIHAMNGMIWYARW